VAAALERRVAVQPLKRRAATAAALERRAAAAAERRAAAAARALRLRLREQLGLRAPPGGARG